MTYPNKRCQHGWLDPSACETCKLLAEVTALRAAYIERAKEPVREWVGLTDDGIDDITARQWGAAVISEAHRAYARAIEAALKAKNTPEETA